MLYSSELDVHAYIYKASRSISLLQAHPTATYQVPHYIYYYVFGTYLKGREN